MPWITTPPERDGAYWARYLRAVGPSLPVIVEYCAAEQTALPMGAIEAEPCAGMEFFTPAIAPPC